MNSNPSVVPPTQTRSSGAPNATHTSAPQVGSARWLLEHRIRPLTRVILREEVESAVQARTSELEREIAALREEIDRRKAAEREQLAAKSAAEAAAAAKVVQLERIGGEFQAPLDALVGAMDLLRKTDLAPDQAALAAIAGDSSRWLRRLVRSILDFSAIEAGKLSLAAVEFDLAEEIQLAIDLQSDAVARKGLGLIVDIDPAVPARVLGDPLRLRQILLHLLDNAVTFTSRGEIAVRVHVERSTADRSSIRVDVTDTGCGIPPSEHAWLFEPFARTANAPARPIGGAGLGLALSKRLIEAMGGNIGIVSAVGSGSTFWFRLELAHAGRTATDSPPPAESMADRHVLIVDDNATNRTLFSHLAAVWTLRSGLAESADAALAYLRAAAREETPVELVLLDHDERSSDGLGLAKAILADPTIPRPALVLLSPRTHYIGRSTLDTHGIAYCEQKPVHPKKLRALIARALRPTK